MLFKRKSKKTATKKGAKGGESWETGKKPVKKSTKSRGKKVGIVGNRGKSPTKRKTNSGVKRMAMKLAASATKENKTKMIKAIARSL